MVLSDNYRLIQLTDKKFDFLKLYQLDPSFYSALLESVSPQNNQAYFDILFLEPQQVLYLDSAQQLFLLKQDGKIAEKQANNNFLQNFNRLWQAAGLPPSSSKNSSSNSNYYPFTGGWFIFLAYELANQIEPALKLTQFDNNLPIAYACRHQSALIYDHQKQQLVLFCENLSYMSKLLNKVTEDIKKVNLLDTQVDTEVDTDEGTVVDSHEISSHFSVLREERSSAYIKAVNQIKNYIIEGDVFQVNLSRKWQTKVTQLEHNKLACYLYQQLREKNPAPFSALVNFSKIENNTSIISSSPERLVKVNKGVVESRPIAGTIPRVNDVEEDNKLIKQLHQHPKEQSEHVMLIDLIRNDLGRLCIAGSIHVNEFMVNESYKHVHHIVSNVVGNLAENIKPGDVISAVFPGGTITGCPKIRCMEIINELENVARGAYTGSLGYINNNGSLDLNILIRTMQLQQTANEYEHNLSLRAGAGIVNDSDPEKELLETIAKAKGMLRVINHVEE